MTANWCQYYGRCLSRSQRCAMKARAVVDTTSTVPLQRQVSTQKYALPQCLWYWAAVCSWAVDHNVTFPLSAYLWPSTSTASGPGHCITSVCTLVEACQPAQSITSTHLLVWQRPDFNYSRQCLMLFSCICNQPTTWNELKQIYIVQEHDNTASQ